MGRGVCPPPARQRAPPQAKADAVGGRPPGPPGCATLPVLEFGSVGERVGDVVLTIVNQDEPRINTKTDGPALLRRRHGRKPTRERGRPARTTLAKPRPSPRPGSTGKDARALLGPGPCRSRRQGGGVRHRRETERQPKGEGAGGTPALPGGPLSSRLPFKGESAQPNWMDGRLKSRFDNPFVALRGSLFFPFSFVSNMMINASMQTLSTLHSPLSTISSGSA